MNFQYSGKNSSGEKVKGKIDANTKKEALLALEKNGLVILEIEETKLWNKDLTITKKVNHKDFVLFLRQYATLIHAGISISEATKTMIEQTESKPLKNALADIDQQLDQGQALSKSAERHPKIFPPLLINMIRAGEASGKLDEILNQMADYFEKQYQNRQKVVSALIYPSVVGVITLLLSIFLLVFVVPQFITMFNSFGEDIPAFTLFILHLSEIVGTYWWIILMLILVAIILYKYLHEKYDQFAYRMDIVKMKFPFLGILVHKGALVRMTQTLSTLVNSAVPILESVEITEKVVGNRVIKSTLEQSRKSLEVGQSITKPMIGHWAFPTLVTQMIQIGEKTGTLDQMLQKVSDFYEEEVDQLSNRIKTLIEPLMIIVLTVMVGSIIAAVVIPMFSLFENLQ
ncbi:type IV pilus assembly protein PilC [Oceanobacillus limi]|uniref:Type IV pilus assembly protein PilC n=1 Tax=Oceanobacillus limi TaxID=930131 RepID=A0A1I0EIM0_9BACI|nr:type II secretion system F family protein [Oceanobacillus limi]SET45033.1 type IV pilus assembly protein PilC [Oceanobacillus limi]